MVWKASSFRQDDHPATYLGKFSAASHHLHTVLPIVQSLACRYHFVESVDQRCGSSPSGENPDPDSDQIRILPFLGCCSEDDLI
jgi:hypothetical protein